MKYDVLIRAAAAALIATITNTAASAAPYRVLWAGTPGASRYEFESAADSAFSRDLKHVELDSANVIVDLPGPQVFARIRSALPERGRWHPLRFVEWKAPRLPAKVEVTAEKHDGPSVSWAAPADPHAAEITYHVRIVTAADITPYDTFLTGTTYTIPPLPRGSYRLIVEPSGDAQEGTLHAEGQAAASATVQAGEDWEAAPRDIHGPAGIIGLTDFFRDGFSFGCEFVTGANSDARRSFLAEDVTFTGRRGLRLGASVRTGTDPFPTISVSQRILFAGESDEQSYLGIGLALAFNGNANGQEFFPSNPAFISLPWRIRNGRWLLDGTLDAGVALASDLKPVQVFTLQLKPSMELRRRLLVGGLLEWHYMSAVSGTAGVGASNQERIFQPAFHSALIGPQARYRLSNWLYGSAQAGFTVGRPDAEPKWTGRTAAIRNYYSIGLTFAF